MCDDVDYDFDDSYPKKGACRGFHTYRTPDHSHPVKECCGKLPTLLTHDDDFIGFSEPVHYSFECRKCEQEWGYSQDIEEVIQEWNQNVSTIRYPCTNCGKSVYCEGDESEGFVYCNRCLRPLNKDEQISMEKEILKDLRELEKLHDQ